MSEPRSLSVQSVLYGNAAEHIMTAGSAISHSVGLARAEGLVGDWALVLGDCSPTQVFTDDSIAPLRSVIESHGGRLEYVVFGENLGSAAGHNALAKRSDSDMMLILNPDAQVSPDALSVLARGLTSDVGIVEARQVPFEHPKEYEKHTGNTSWASTACALTSRTIFNRVGGFDSDTFFLYCDDVDYSWQLRLAGYRVVYEPAATVFHDKRLTIDGDWPASPAEVYYSAEAAILIAHKYSRPDLVKKTIQQFRKQGDPAVLKAIAEYESRKLDDRLPTPVDANHKVGAFIKGNYAVHRF